MIDEKPQEENKDYFYGLTVNGIQPYIFQTNNLREIIGASEIVQAVCTDWFDAFLSKHPECSDGIKLQNAAGNIKYMIGKDGAHKIYENFGEYLTKNAPGLPFSQAIAPDLDALEVALSAQRNVPQHHFDLGHMSRYVARTTGDMAVVMEQKNIGQEAFENYKKKRKSGIDAANFEKFYMSVQAKKRLCETADLDDRWLVKDFEKMAIGGKHSWLSLVHIDGNGMGKHILALAAKYTNDKERSNAIKNFAKKFSDCTEDAFKVSFSETFEMEFLKTENGIKKLIDSKKEIPFRPLILGGDDVTVILRSDYALHFVQTFLKKFEEFTEKSFKGEFIVKENGAIQDKFTACAGIAFVKAKFPFHYTTHLAEELCSEAKEASERKKSALLFHKVSDSFISDYKELVDRELTINKGKSNEMRLSKNFYDLNEIDELLDNLEKIQAEKGLKNTMRQWMDLTLNESPEATLIDQRARKKYKEKIVWTDIKKELFADYLTLIAVNKI